MNKRLIAALLIAAITVTVFVSCSDSGGAGKSATDTTSSQITTAGDETIDYLTALEKKDFGNETFTILCREEKKYEMFSEEENGEPVNDAVYKRNSRVEDYYNIDIQVNAIPGVTQYKDSFISTVENSVLSADCAYDMIAAHLTFFATVAIDGALMNLYDLPSLDMSNPWWAKGFVDNNTVSGKLYITTGNLAFSMYESLYVIFFSKQLAEDNGIPDLYATIDSGDWTLEEMRKYISLVSKDLDGNSKYDTNDCYGMIINHHCARVFQTCLDLPITERNDEGTYNFVYNSEKLFNAYEKVYDLLYNSGNNVYLSKPTADTDYTEMLRIFGDNRALFYTGTLEYTSQMRNMDSDFGILPFPKLDSAQTDYITHAYGGTSIFSVPLVIKNPELSGMILEALCAESTATTIPAFYDIVLQTKFVRDDNSARMLEMIADNVYFDFGYLHSFYMDQIFQLFGDTLWLKKPSLSSTFAQKEKLYQTKFDEIMEKYADLED